MKLVSLKLLNYRRFRQEEIFFKDNFSLIFWKNWAWKSSILDAIWYAMFGPSSKDFVRVNSSLLKSHFIIDREPSKIELNFMLWFDNYRIVRVIDAWIKKLSTDFIPDSKDILVWPNWLEIIGWTEVTNYLISLLWVSRDTFLRSVFAKQKDLEVLSGTMQERKNLINSILWLDKIEFLIFDVKKQAKDKKTVLEYLKTTIENFDFKELQDQKELLNQELIKITKDLEDISLKKIALDKDFLTIKTDFEQIWIKKTTFTNLNSQILLKDKEKQNILKNIEEKKQNILEIEKKEIYLEENKEVLTNLQKVQNDLNILNVNRQKYIQKMALNKELENLNKDLEILKISLKNFENIDFKAKQKSLEEEISKNETQIQENQNLTSKLQADIDLLIKSWKELRAELENINTLWSEADCPTCKRPLNTHFPKLVELFEKELATKTSDYKAKNAELLEKTKIIETLKNLSQTKKQELLELNTKEKEFLVISQKETSLVENLKNLELKSKEFSEIIFSEDEFNLVQNNYKDLELKAKNYNIILWEVSQKSVILEYLNNSWNLILQIDENIKTLKNDLQKLNYLEEDYLKIKQKYDEINSEIFKNNSILNSIQSQKMDVEFKQKTLEKKENDIKDSKKQIDELVLEIDYLNLKKDVLWDYMIYLLNHLKPAIEDLASQYFALITDNKYSSITLDSEYNIMIDEKNIDLYSGWERDLANLCLRLSLWQNISYNNSNPINFLILDEVLASQDKERQQNILINLKKLEQKFSQIILISHLEDIKEMATNMIEVKQKNIEESTVCYW